MLNDQGEVCATDRHITILDHQIYMTRSLFDRLSGNNGYRLTVNSAAIAGLVSVLVNNLNIDAVNVVEVFNATTVVFPMSREVAMVFSNQLTDAVTGPRYCPEIGDGQGLTTREMLITLAILLVPYVVLGGVVTIGVGSAAVVTTVQAWAAAKTAAAGAAAGTGAVAVQQVGRVITLSNGKKIQLVTNTTAVSYTGNITLANVQHFSLVNGQWIQVANNVVNNVINAQDLVWSDSAPHAGRLYQESILLIQEIINSGPPGPDPRGRGGLWWIVEGVHYVNGKMSQGTFELLLSPDGTTIWHFLFKGR